MTLIPKIKSLISTMSQEDLAELTLAIELAKSSVRRQYRVEAQLSFPEKTNNDIADVYEFTNMVQAALGSIDVGAYGAKWDTLEITEILPK